MAFAAQRRKPGEYGDMTGITQERVGGGGGWGKVHSRRELAPDRAEHEGNLY